MFQPLKVKCHIKTREAKEKRKRTRAFTLIEILVVMALLVMVIGASVAIFRTSTVSWRKGQTRADRYQKARFILERLSREISSIVPVAAAGPYFLGFSDRLYFVYTAAGGDSSFVEAGYFLDAARQQLMRGYQDFPDYDFDTVDETEVFSAGVSFLGFEYLDADTWVQSWDSAPEGLQEGRLPRAVKVNFNIVDEQRGLEESFSTVVSVEAYQ